MNKIILITGTSRGLGLAMTRVLLEDGNTVYACARNPENPNLKALQEQFGSRLVRVAMDVTDSDSVARAAQEVKKTTDHLDRVINNAATHPPDSKSPLEEMDPDNCLQTFDSNTVGPLRVTKALLSLLENGTDPVLVNISSEAGSSTDCPRDREFAYCMSKAALNMESVLLHNYLKDRNVRVLAIHPGWVRTDMGGPNAHLDAKTSARRVIGVMEHPPETGVFVDNEGNALRF